MATIIALTITGDKVHADQWDVKVEGFKIGWVRRKKKDARTRATSYTFIPERDCEKAEVLSLFTVPSMTEVREELNRQLDDTPVQAVRGADRA